MVKVHQSMKQGNNVDW